MIRVETRVCRPFHQLAYPQALLYTNYIRKSKKILANSQYLITK
jgi:hypothetical protein